MIINCPKSVQSAKSVKISDQKSVKRRSSLEHI